MIIITSPHLTHFTIRYTNIIAIWCCWWELSHLPKGTLDSFEVWCEQPKYVFTRCAQNVKSLIMFIYLVSLTTRRSCRVIYYDMCLHSELTHMLYGCCGDLWYCTYDDDDDIDMVNQWLWCFKGGWTWYAMTMSLWPYTVQNGSAVSKSTHGRPTIEGCQLLPTTIQITISPTRNRTHHLHIINAFDMKYLHKCK